MSNKGIIGNLDETEKRCEWEIPNFFSLCQTDCFCESPSFPFANASFHLRIYPLCSPYDFLSLYLKCDSEPSPDVTYSFSIRKNDGTLIGTATKPYVFNQCNGFAKFFKGRYLRTQALELLPADTLTIICELKSDFPEKQTLSNANEANNLKEKTEVEASEQIRLTGMEFTFYYYLIKYVYKNH